MLPIPKIENRFRAKSPKPLIQFLVSMVILIVTTKEGFSKPVLNDPCVTGALKNIHKWENLTMNQRAT